MQTQQRNWISIQPSHVVSFVVRTSSIATLSLAVAAALLGSGGAEMDALAHSACTNQNRTQITAGGETLANGANRNRISPLLIDRQSGLAISNSQDRYPQSGQQNCAPDVKIGYRTQSADLVVHTQTRNARITRFDEVAQPDNRATSLVRAVQVSSPSKSSKSSKSSSSKSSGSTSISSGQAAVGTHNVFPYGQCTWWADQRYYQLHGVYVPWTINANAGQWVARAKQFHWIVSSRPQAGDILVLQPGVQGASGLGHVAVVEKVLPNGDVSASSMNWGANPQNVTYFEFAPGPGVAFVRR